METDKPDEEPIDEVQRRQRLIGKEIRRYFDDTAKEAVPQQLLDLLQQADSEGKPDDGH